MKIDTSNETSFVAACAETMRHCPNPHARAYAAAGVPMLDPHAIQVQSLYILNNISHWRGEQASKLRAVFKAYGKVK